MRESTRPSAASATLGSPGQEPEWAAPVVVVDKALAVVVDVPQGGLEVAVPHDILEGLGVTGSA